MNDEFNKEPLSGEDNSAENKVEADIEATVETVEETVEEIKDDIKPESTVETDTSKANSQPTEEFQPVSQQTEDNSQPNYTDFNNNYEQKHYIPNGVYINGNAQNQNGNNSGKPPRNNKKGLKIFAIILSAALIFSVGTVTGRLFGSAVKNDFSSSESDGSIKYEGEDIDIDSEDSVEADDIEPGDDGKYTADQVAKIVGESVVNIQVYSTTDSSSGATASGVILNEKGYIITNDHIYSSVNNAKFIVTTNDGNSYKASYVAGDLRSDIAVLKFDEIPKNIKPATFIKDSNKIKTGEDVIAIGSPYGFSGSVTKGIISYPSRRITVSNSSDSSDSSAQSVSYSMRVIQTDAALNSGNSGGALVNMYGQVIGISSSKISSTGYEGLCFAIPSNDAIKYAKSLAKNGEVVGRAKLGITYTGISSAAALVNDIPSGLRIQSIDSASELYSKGVTTGTNGDIITSINGKKIINSDIALDVIDDSSAGDTVKLEIYSVSTKKTKTYNIKLLEDTSNTSYSNEIPKATTSANNGYYYYGNGNDEYGNDDSNNPFSFDFGN